MYVYAHPLIFPRHLAVVVYFFLLFVQLVMFAIEQDGRALQHASPGYRDDWQVAGFACQQDWRALEFCSHRLRCDSAFCKKVRKERGWGHV